MAGKTWTEKEIKDLIKDTLKQELKSVNKEIESKTDEAKVKEIVRTTLVQMYKYLWQKSSTYIKQI
jgi:ArsR family metal-binding transcriptional regulator